MTLKQELSTSAIYIALFAISISLIYILTDRINARSYISSNFFETYEKIRKREPFDLIQLNSALSKAPNKIENYVSYMTLLNKIEQPSDTAIEKIISLRPNWSHAWVWSAKQQTSVKSKKLLSIASTKIALKLTPNDLFTNLSSTRILFSNWQFLTIDDKSLAFQLLNKLEQFSYYKMIDVLLWLIPDILSSDNHFNNSEEKNIKSFIQNLTRANYKKTITHAVNNNWYPYLEPLLIERKHKEYLRRSLTRKNSISDAT